MKKSKTNVCRGGSKPLLNKGKKLKLTTLGFTLIELLAVIVILAIVALIATPIILNIINDAKEQANRRSAEMYLKAVDNEIASLAINNETIPDGSYKIENGNICLDDRCEGKIEVKITGEVPASGTMVFQKGKVAQGTILKYENNDSFTINEKGELVLKEIKTYKDGDIVYFDVKTGKSCKEEDYKVDNSKTGYNGYTNKDSSNNETSKLESQNSCLKFYAFLDDGSHKLNLLLDHNTTANKAWNSSNSNSTGPKEVINYLKMDTNSWGGTITPSQYKYKGLVSSYTIDYSEYKARLITAQEIAQITGADQESILNWKEESSTIWYYLHNYSQDETTGRGDVCKKDGCKYGWLYDRTSTNCTDYGCLNNAVGQTSGYWTASALSNNSSDAWRIINYGTMNYNNVDTSFFYGIRPVIEVLKSSL